MNTPLPRPPAERFAGVVRTLQQALAVQGIGGRLVGPLLILVWNRLSLYVRRVAALAARAADGTLRPPAPSRPRRPAPAAPACPPAHPPPCPPALHIPRGFAWLIRIAPGVAGGRSQLRYLLADPDMAALIAAAPQVGRSLRPLCRMLGLPLPPLLHLPPRPRRPARRNRTPPTTANPATPAGPAAPRTTAPRTTEYRSTPPPPSRPTPHRGPPARPAPSPRAHGPPLP